jgi:hypothetical protein
MHRWESGGHVLKKYVRKAVLAYSKRNRQRKAESIVKFPERNNVKDVLFIGSTGDEGATDPYMSNLGIVERRIAEQYEVKMGINRYPAKNPTHPFMVADARDTFSRRVVRSRPSLQAATVLTGQRLDDQRPAQQPRSPSRTR